MRRARVSKCIIVLGLLVSSAGVELLGAQRTPSSETVPRELLTAVLGLFRQYGGPPEPGIQVGSVSADVRARLPEIPGTHVIGSVTFMPFGNIVVLDAPIPSDSLRHSVERSLQAKGFEKSKQRMEQGFVATSPDVPGMWCGEGTTVLVFTQALDNGTSVARIVVGGDVMTGGCARRFGDASPMMEMPTLYDPEGAVSHNQKCFMAQNGGLGTATTNAVVVQLAPSQLLDHYGKQLQDSGWTRADLSGSAGARVSRIWMRHPPGQGVEYLTLSVTVPPDQASCRLVEMALQKSQSR